MNTVHITYHLEGIGEPLQESIKKYVQRNLYVNPEVDAPLLKPYFKKIFTNKPDAVVALHIHVEKTKTDRFEGKFMCDVDGQSIRYERSGSESFKSPSDLVNHAFSHIKREITGDRGIFRKIT
jgi:hypothetical protein